MKKSLSLVVWENQPDSKIHYITIYEYPDLKKAYDNAVKNKQKFFTFYGYDILIDYAKYLLDYMEPFYKAF